MKVRMTFTWTEVYDDAPSIEQAREQAWQDLRDLMDNYPYDMDGAMDAEVLEEEYE